ncbi:MAG: hypothetical protein FWD60_09660 [Candidatus Azobacteroides sp.]|nr:hypothetical protein [Candidatus Azobacteroides sp.]
MKKVFLSLLIAATVSANLAYSQEKKQEAPEKKGEMVAPSPAMQTIILAGQLAKYGYENNSASALIQAAELYLSVGLTEFKPDSVMIGKGEETTKDEYVSHDPQKILADAKTLADGDQVLLSMIDKVAKAKTSRGAVGGPKYGEYKVFANSYNLFNVKFWANERATVVVTGDGDTDLDLYVYDENGNLIAKDEDYSDDCVVNFVPRWTGLYVIKILNRGNVYNRYAVGTN